jgi:hypothetical protein
MIPTFMLSSARAISSRLRIPFSMSVDIHGLAFWRTFPSHSLRASAARLLRSPDQLMKTLCVSADMAACSCTCELIVSPGECRVLYHPESAGGCRDNCSVWWSPRKDIPMTPKNDSDNARNRGDNVSDSPIRVTVESLPPAPAESEEDKAEKKFDRRLKRWKVILEILAFLALVTYVWETRRSNNLTAEALRFQAGANVRVNYQTGWYDLGEGKSANVVVIIQNDGARISAESVELRAELEYRKFPPEPTLSNFSRGEAQQVTSLKGAPVGVLLPITPQFDAAGYRRVWVNNPSEYSSYKMGTSQLYLWGTVTFKDRLSDAPPPITFCRFMTATDLLTATSDEGNAKGGSIGPGHACARP